MVLTGGYASPATRARRHAAAGLERVAGIDGNVSNLSIVSLPDTLDPADGALASSRVELTEQEVGALARAERRARDWRRALDRSRRATNARQYGLSKRQQARAERRVQAGLSERQVTVPGGARVANAAGVPKQAYRKDDLSAGYRLDRVRIAEAAAAAAEAKDARARRIAAEIVGPHGAHLTVGDCDICTGSAGGARSCRPRPQAAHRGDRARGGEDRRAAAARVDVRDETLADVPVRRRGHKDPRRPDPRLPRLRARR
jgi:hypothetical protein